MTITGWAVTIGLIAALIAFDLWQSRRDPYPTGWRGACAWSLAYIGVAMLFGVVFGIIAGWDLGGQYFAGYIVERSLSVDNLFVFVIVMGTFAVPGDQRSRLLMLGAVAALVLRAVFIALGAAMIEAFSFTYLIFGLALTATAIQLLRHRDSDPSINDNVVVTAARRFVPVTDRYDQHRLFIRTARRRALTPLALALLAIASTDFVFALDSIPAVFGVTQHAYVVFAANAFALLGLRPLFFLVSGLLDRLVYLSAGLAAILVFIGAKLVLHFAHLHADGVPEISTGVSLAVIAVVLAGTTLASLVRSRREGPGQPEPGQEAALGEPRDGRDALGRKGEDHQPVGAGNRRLCVREIAAEGRLAVGAGWH